jgi:hypothetical protein
MHLAQISRGWLNAATKNPDISSAYWFERVATIRYLCSVHFENYWSGGLVEQG